MQSQLHANMDDHTALFDCFIDIDKQHSIGARTTGAIIDGVYPHIIPGTAKDVRRHVYVLLSVWSV